MVDGHKVRVDTVVAPPTTTTFRLGLWTKSHFAWSRCWVCTNFRCNRLFPGFCCHGNNYPSHPLVTMMIAELK